MWEGKRTEGFDRGSLRVIQGTSARKRWAEGAAGGSEGQLAMGFR